MADESKAQVTFLSGVQYEHLIAGLTGGVLSTLITHPFDLLKLRFAGMAGQLAGIQIYYCSEMTSSYIKYCTHST